SVHAADDVDISYLRFSVTGLRASDLRAAGGILDAARASAFATTDGTAVLYPTSEGQTTFALPLPVASALSAAEIAHNGVVVADITAVDSSGNEATTSKVAFTGSDVVETASA